ncbi:MAG: GTP cyclohydrolase I FolE2 [Burkholderiales bacterium]|nr:MAG: GTP cyclohydrolase I FolE2 [Burkholderiales bacterium]
MNIRDTSTLLAGVMADVQGSPDRRELPIQRVGVKGLRYPLRWRSAGGEQPSVGQFGLYVALPADQKGTHMSRFLELLEARLAADRPALDASGLRATFAEMLTLLEAQSGRIELSLPLFVRKTAPVSQVQSLMDYDLSIAVDGGARDAVTTLTVLVPCTSLCPCSKTISDYGAHNQRSHVTVSVQTEAAIEPEDLIALVEAQASSELYGLLKRVDEKHVTERAYDNPKFVEDLVRDVAVALRGDARIRRFVVEAENFESIHNHSAYARLEG